MVKTADPVGMVMTGGRVATGMTVVAGAVAGADAAVVEAGEAVVDAVAVVEVFRAALPLKTCRPHLSGKARLAMKAPLTAEMFPR